MGGREEGINIERPSNRLIIHSIIKASIGYNNACIVGYMSTSANAVMFITHSFGSNVLCVDKSAMSSLCVFCGHVSI